MLIHLELVKPSQRNLRRMHFALKSYTANLSRVVCLVLFNETSILATVLPTWATELDFQLFCFSGAEIAQNKHAEDRRIL